MCILDSRSNVNVSIRYCSLIGRGRKAHRSDSLPIRANDCINTRGDAVHGEIEGVCCSHAA